MSSIKLLPAFFSASPLTSFKKHPLAMAVSLIIGSVSGMAIAGPEGAAVTGGRGSISQRGNTTTINQATDRMAIDWQSYNVAADERIHYIQPDSSSISLNTILSNTGSQIHGRIDANGQVILVNPNGILFGPTSVINVGGILASGLTINPDDFMNGDFAFHAVEGKEGVIINSGLIYAATGGSVGLLGRRVENRGLIEAELGAITLASGKEAYISFDPQGLFGIAITESVLQDTLGVDAAVINSGELNASGGKVLLTASASEDIFTHAVNLGEMRDATSVMVNDDGSFRLSAGGDVVNTGEIHVSSEQAGGDIILVGDNITHTGEIKADGHFQAGGHIELASRNTTLTNENSIITANSTEAQGGEIKVLGNHIGILGDSEITANAANGNGQILIGGDTRGENVSIQNANAVYIGHNTEISVNATESGEAGRVVAYGENLLRAYGTISAEGLGEANGGFIETSAGMVDLDLNISVASENAEAGLWLIDPWDITIQDSGSTNLEESDGSTQGVDRLFLPNSNPTEAENSIIRTSSIKAALASNSGATVLIETSGDGEQEGNITLVDDFLYDGIGTNDSLILRAHNNIDIQRSIYDNDSSGNDSLNLSFIADSDNSGSGDIIIGGRGYNVDINLEGGQFYAYGNNFSLGFQDYTPSGGSLTESQSSITTGNGDAAIFAYGDVDLFGNITTNNGDIIIGGDHDSESFTYPMLGISPNNPPSENQAAIRNSFIAHLGDLSGGWNTNSTLTADIIPTHVRSFFAAGSANGDTLHEISSTLNLASYPGDGNLDIQSSGAVALGAINIGERGTSDASNGNNEDNQSYFRVSAQTIALQGNIAYGANGSNSTHTLHLNLNASDAINIYSGSIDNSGGNDQLNVYLNNEAVLSENGAMALGENIYSNSDITFSRANIWLTGGNFHAHGRRFILDGTAGDIALINTEGGSISGGMFIDAASVTLGRYSAVRTQSANDITINITDFADINGALSATNNNDNGNVIIRGSSTTDNTFTLGEYASWNGGNAYINDSVAGTRGGNDTFYIYTDIGASIIGGTGDDTYYVAASGIGFTISDNGGTDTLYGFDDGINTNTWDVNSTTSTLTNNGGVVNFTGMDSLVGGEGQDSFRIHTSDTTASLQGGDGNNDQLILESENNGQWHITGENSGSLNTTITFAGMESLFGSDGGNDTLMGRNQHNLWVINSEGGGAVEQNIVDATDTINFFDFENITGGTSEDIFRFDTAGTITGIVHGGNGAGDNTIQGRTANTSWELFTGASAGRVRQNEGSINYIADFRNIQVLQGRASIDTLTARDQHNTWTLETQANGGFRVANTEDASDHVSFSGMDNLRGGNGTDTFNILTAVTAPLFGGDGSDIFNFGDQGSVTCITAGTCIDGGTSANDNDRIAARSTENHWFIRVANNNLSQNNSLADHTDTPHTDTPYLTDFRNIETLQGSDTAADIYQYSVGSFHQFIAGDSAGDRLDVSSVNGVVNIGLNAASGMDILLGNNNGLTSPQTNRTHLTYSSNSDETITWDIGDIAGMNEADGINDGVVGDGVVGGTQFINVNHLIGGEGNDHFIYDQTVTTDTGVVGITGSITGGGQIDDGQADNAGDTLQVANVVNRWNLGVDPNERNVEYNHGLGGDMPQSTTQFFEIETLISGNQADTFNIDTTDINITVYAGDGNDTLRLPNEDTNLTLGMSLGSGLAVNDVEILRASSFYHNQLTVTSLNGENIDWDIDGTNRGLVQVGNDPSTRFEHFQILVGGNGNDTFDFSSGGRLIDRRGEESGIQGAGGNNTLIGQNTHSRWRITGDHSGELADITMPDAPVNYVEAFSGIHHLRGGTGNDNFIVTSTGSITGLIQGNDGTNTLTVDSVSGQTHEWQLLHTTDPDRVRRINNTDSSIITSNITFTDIDSLVGGSGKDIFKFLSAGLFNGTINALGGTDTVDRSAVVGPISVILGASDINGVTQAERVVGNGANSILSGLNSGTNTWRVSTTTSAGDDIDGADGSNDGILHNSAGQNIEFINFATLQGSDTAIDNVQITDTGNITGQILGGANSGDSITVETEHGRWVQTTLWDGTVADITFLGFETWEGAGNNDTLVGLNQSNHWQVTGLNEGTVSELNITGPVLNFAGMENLSGNQGSDHFTFVNNASSNNSRISGTLAGTDSAFTDINGTDTLSVDSASGDALQWRLGTADNVTQGAIITRVNRFNTLEEYNGGDGTDTFIIEQANVNATIEGAGGANDLLRLDYGSGTQWVLDGEDERVTANNGGQVNFREIEIAEGSDSGRDEFRVNNAATVTRTLRGRGGGADSLNVTALTNGVVIEMGNGITAGNPDTTGLLPNFHIDQIEHLTASAASAENNWLVSNLAGDYRWDITGNNDGRITLTSGDSFEPMTFTDFGYLRGGAGNDLFQFTDNGAISNEFDGGAGGNDEANFADITHNITIDLDNSNASGIHFSGIEAITGNHNGDESLTHTATLSVATGSNTWTIESINEGTLNSSTLGQITFSGFNEIEGGNQRDLFDLNTSGTLTGRIDGGANTDSAILDELNIDDVNSARTVHLITADETATYGQLNVINIEEFNASDIGNTLISAATGDNHWNITESNTGRLNDLPFTGFNRLVGNNAIDDFNVSAGASLASINGLDGNDTLTLNTDDNSNVLRWQITGNNAGRAGTQQTVPANNRIGEFLNIENLTGGLGADTFIFTRLSSVISGMIDGGDDSNQTDILNLRGLTNGVVVEYGESVYPGNIVLFDPPSSAPTNVHADNIETIIAAEGSLAEEANNWLAITHDHNIELRLYSNQVNRGWFREVDQIVEPVIPISNSRVEFQNFGSFQESGGDVLSENITTGVEVTSAFHLSGEYRVGTGQVNIDITGTGFSVVNITDRILNVNGNGNTLLRVVDDTDPDAIAFNNANTWTINESNAGRFDINTPDPESEFGFTFSGVNQLYGGTGDDTFQFTESGRLTGQLTVIDSDTGETFSVGAAISGGGGHDQITSLSSQDFTFGISQFQQHVPVSNARPETIKYVDALLSRDNIIDLHGIETLTGNDTVTTQLLSADTGNFTWNIGATASDSTLIDMDANTRLRFSNVDQIFGGNGNDTFIIQELGRVANHYQGAGGNDTLDLTLINQDLNVSLDNAITADLYLNNIETLQLADQNHTLFGAAFHSTWTIDDTNAGTLTYNDGTHNQSLTFTHIANLVGNSEQDQFIVTDTGSIEGRIQAGAGQDRLSIQLANGRNGQINSFDGGDNNDILVVQGGDANNRLNVNYTANTDGTARFLYERIVSDSTLRYNIDYTAVETVNQQAYTDTLTVNPVSETNTTTNNTNRIQLANQYVQVGTHTAIHYSNTQSLSVNGSQGDTAEFNGLVSLNENLTLSNVTIDPGENGRLQAGNHLTFDHTGPLGTAENRLQIETPRLTLTAVGGDSYIEQNGDLILAGLTHPEGVLDIQASGSIADDAVLNSTHNIHLNANGDITLDNANNLSGNLRLISPNGHITLNNSATELSEIQARNLTLMARANMDDHGPIRVADTTTFINSDTSVVRLDHETNTFNQLNIDSAGSVIIRDHSTQGVTVSGNASDTIDIVSDAQLIANGTQASNILFTSNTSQIIVQDNLVAENLIELTGNGVTVAGALSVERATSDHAVRIDGRNNQISIQSEIDAAQNLSGDVIISGRQIEQQTGAHIAGRNLDLNATDTITLSGHITADETIDIDSTGSDITFTRATPETLAQAQHINIHAHQHITTQAIQTGDLILTADNGNITLQDDIHTSGNTTLTTHTGTLELARNTHIQSQGRELIVDAQSIDINGSITASHTTGRLTSTHNQTINGNLAFNQLELNVGDQLLMVQGASLQANSTLTATTGSDFRVASVQAGESITLNIGGAVSDNNGDGINFTSNALIAETQTGFGRIEETVETAVANMDIVNASGRVGVTNNQNLNVTALINNGDIVLENTQGNVILNNRAQANYDLTQTGTRAAGGVIDANYNEGILRLNVLNGYLAALPPRPDSRRPELIGNSVEVSTRDGFGISPRQIVVYAQTEMIISGPGIRPIWAYGIRPELGLITDSDLIDPSIISSVADLFIDVEDIGEIDPAIFTNVLNYVYEDISIRMPRDQLYEDDEQDEDKRWDDL